MVRPGSWHQRSKVTEEPDQDDERDGHAQKQEQDGTHLPISSNEVTPVQMTTTRSRSLPPIVAAKLAQKAPTRRARNVQYMECPSALRAPSAACRAWT